MPKRVEFLPKKPHIKLFTLKGLAAAEDVSEDYLRKMLMDFRKGERSEWRGYNFISLGSTKRNIWLSYKNSDAIIEVADAPDV